MLTHAWAQRLTETAITSSACQYVSISPRDRSWREDGACDPKATEWIATCHACLAQVATRTTVTLCPCGALMLHALHEHCLQRRESHQEVSVH